MADSQRWHDVLVTLRRITRATDLHSKQVFKHCGLTIPQIMVLRAIASLGDVTVRRLSEEVSLSQATVTTILNRLESRELVIRVRCSVNKRVVNARLTEQGVSKLENTPPLLHEAFIQRFDKLESWEQLQMLSTLQRAAAMMNASKMEEDALLEDVVDEIEGVAQAK